MSNPNNPRAVGLMLLAYWEKWGLVSGVWEKWGRKIGWDSCCIVYMEVLIDDEVESEWVGVAATAIKTILVLLGDL